MNLTLHIWRQRNASEKGRMVRYDVPDVNPEMSFLEMLDVLNEGLLAKGEELNQSLEKARRVGDFFELGELMCRDALERNESCGGHFREESQTPDGEALRNDERCAYVAAWEYQGDGASPELHKEPLAFEYVHPSQRSYK
jgi:succinate dehydrogenase / fumarate reductase, flavoprotein subunit